MKFDRRRIRRLVLRIAPYVLTVVVVLAILQRYSLSEIVEAMRAGNAFALLPIAIAFSLVQIVLVSAWDAIVLQSVLGGPRYVDVVRVKAGCAVLQTVGYLLNQGAYGTWIARATGTGARTAVALVLFTAGSDLAAGAFVASIAMAIGGVDPGPFLRIGAPIVFVAMVLLLVAPKRSGFDVTTDEPSVLRVFRAVPRGRALLQLALRLTNAALIVVTIWIAARAFGLPLPFGAALAYVPIILLVGSLPVNVMGLGPVQGTWLLFTEWVPGPSILAFQIAWNVAILLAYVLRGAAFVPRILREVGEGRAAPA